MNKLLFNFNVQLVSIYLSWKRYLFTMTRAITWHNKSQYTSAIIITDTDWTIIHGNDVNFSNLQHEEKVLHGM